MDSDLKAGDIVRYADGISALVKLIAPHAGGWHGDHVLGGTQFVSDQIFSKLKLADSEDIKFCEKNRSEWFRPKLLI